MSGGGSYFPGDPNELRRLLERSKERVENLQFDIEVNDLLQNQLIRLNQRDTDKVNEYLDQLVEILSKEYKIERFRFGGSVAKHTYVDGLSDIDGLCILDRKELAGESPGEVRHTFFELLDNNLPSKDVKQVEEGTIAVTVTYNDDTEIQLLPAIRAGKDVAISNSTGNSWKYINPEAFQKELTNVNKKLNGLLIPTIKLAKSIRDSLPEKQRVDGIHLESLAVEAAKTFSGPLTLKTLLTHFFNDSSKRVLTPIPDVTGQSRNVDSDLGQANSTDRQSISTAFATIGRRLESAKTIEEWEAILKE